MHFGERGHTIISGMSIRPKRKQDAKASTIFGSKSVPDLSQYFLGIEW